MKRILIYSLFLLVPSVATAKKKSQPPAPLSQNHVHFDDLSAIRKSETKMHVSVASSGAIGEKAEEDVSNVPKVEVQRHDDEPSVDDSLTRERVEKHLRRYQPAIDSCAAEAKKAGMQGVMKLELEILDRHVTIKTDDKSTDKTDEKSAELTKCLTTASTQWTLPAAKLSLPLIVSLN